MDTVNSLVVEVGAVNTASFRLALSSASCDLTIEIALVVESDKIKLYSALSGVLANPGAPAAACAKAI
jgi:hypothetical protein